MTLGKLVVSGRRNLFIQTKETPNDDALKFVPNANIIPADINKPFIEYTNPKATISPPYPSPLAASLMNIDGVISVFYGADFVTVTKAPDVEWAHIRPEIFSLITEAIASGQAIVNVSRSGAADENADDATTEGDSLTYNENDSELVGMVKELLQTRVRPVIQNDGGDIEFRGLDANNNVMLKLRGACRTCDSSTETLKQGIEKMLTFYVSLMFKYLQISY
jgi:NFU1 iron-sulfur cluster scaffold homolog, mitochondrial